MMNNHQGDPALFKAVSTLKTEMMNDRFGSANRRTKASRDAGQDHARTQKARQNRRGLMTGSPSAVPRRGAMAAFSIAMRWHNNTAFKIDPHDAIPVPEAAAPRSPPPRPNSSDGAHTQKRCLADERRAVKRDHRVVQSAKHHDHPNPRQLIERSPISHRIGPGCSSGVSTTITTEPRGMQQHHHRVVAGADLASARANKRLVLVLASMISPSRCNATSPTIQTTGLCSVPANLASRSSSRRSSCRR